MLLELVLMPAIAAMHMLSVHCNNHCFLHNQKALASSTPSTIALRELQICLLAQTNLPYTSWHCTKKPWVKQYEAWLLTPLT